MKPHHYFAIQVETCPWESSDGKTEQFFIFYKDINSITKQPQMFIYNWHLANGDPMLRTGASFLIILTCPFFTSFFIYFLFPFRFSLAIDIFKGHRQLPVQLSNLIILLGAAMLF